MDITSWTSAGINWEKPQLSSLYDALESIRLALLERVQVTGLANNGVTKETVKKLSDEIKLNSVYESINTFHACITYLIPLFVNHLDNSGSWNNADSIPAWTEESILEAIDDNERFYPCKIDSPSKWIIQAYKILNMLKWYKVYRHAYYNYNAPEQFKFSHYVYGYDWNSVRTTAINNYLNQEWVFSDSRRFCGECCFIGIDPLWGVITFDFLTRSRSLIEPPDNYQSMNHTIDVDLYGQTNDWGGRGESTYDREKAGVDYQKYKLFETKSINIQSVGNNPWFELGYDDSIPYEIPLSQTDINLGWEIRAIAMILKFDGENGFKFLTADE